MRIKCEGILSIHVLYRFYIKLEEITIYTIIAACILRWTWDATPGRGPESDNLKSGKIYVSHDVTNFEFFYEPFYVARDTVPAHDERFMGYGYTRNTQASFIRITQRNVAKISDSSISFTSTDTIQYRHNEWLSITF